MEKNCCKVNKTPPPFLAILKNYKPLIIILIFCILLPIGQFGYSNTKFMNLFMGYFLIFLSLFKFFDIEGFANGFSTYDILAKKFNFYGYIYPFIEFFLGILYLRNTHPILTNFITAIIMLVGGLGILKTILSGQKIKCACLGTSLNVPLGTISIIENFGMGLMALYNLITA